MIFSQFFINEEFFVISAEFLFFPHFCAKIRNNS